MGGNDRNRKGVFQAAARLIGAHFAAPGFSTSRQLDALAENDQDMQVLKILIRQYGCEAENVLRVYEEYFAIKKECDFWSYFNTRLGLPNDWYLSK